MWQMRKVLVRSYGVATCRKGRTLGHLALVPTLVVMVKSALVLSVGLRNRPRYAVASGRGVPLRSCVCKKAELG